MRSFYLYSISKNAFLMQKDLGHTDKLDIAGVFSHKDALLKLKASNVDSQEVVPINAKDPSCKPDNLENKLNCRVYAYQIRKQLFACGFDKDHVLLTEIISSFKECMTIGNFIARKTSAKGVVDSFNSALCASGGGINEHT